MNTIWYHGTSIETWEAIQKEGVLWGLRGGPSRCTYLAADLEEAKCYGEVVLEIIYNPLEDKGNNNYIENCWQMRVYSPISLENIRRIQ